MTTIGIPPSLPPFLVSPEYAARVSATQTEAQAPKAGLLTTEFWLHVLALIIPAALQALLHSDNPTLVISAQVAASVYTLARSSIKTQNSKQVGAVVKAAIDSTTAAP